MGATALHDDSAVLLARYRALGLSRVDELKLTRNRRTMVSIRGRTLRVHRGYRDAPIEVQQAVVDFVMRSGSSRTAARSAITTWAAQIQHDDRPARVERTHPEDTPIVARLVECHARFNAERFGGVLGTPVMRVSRRMKARLGHYAPGRRGIGAEIAISVRHLRRDGVREALHTLLHEMVHQWQDEAGLPLDHGAAFKKKAREVGVVPRATRPVD